MSPSYDVHRPDFEGTTAEELEDPSVADYDASDPGELADRVLLSASGFPPDDASDLALPVVDAEDRLSLRALEAARSGVEGVDADADLSASTQAEARRLVETLVAEHFEEGDPEARPEDGTQAHREARAAANERQREQRAEAQDLRETEAQETNREDIPPDQDSSG